MGHNSMVNQSRMGIGMGMGMGMSQQINGLSQIRASQDGGVFVAPSMPIPSHVSMTADIVHNLRLDCGEDT
jgi:hypothetical protein